MSQIHIRHLKTHFEKYRPYIDLSDVKSSDPHNLENHFLSRALSLFTLDNQIEIDLQQASQCIVDAFDDNGIDLVYFDQTNYTLYLIQSKFIHSGNGGPEQGDIKKYCDGIRDLIEGRYNNFSDKLQKLIPMIQLALDDTKTKLKGYICFTGNQLSEHAKRDLERLEEEVNDPSEYIEILPADLSELHKWLTGLAQANDISFEILLSEWGKTELPLPSYYGQVNCLEIASIFEKFSSKMLNQNIRKFLGDTNINESIQKTIIEHPERFFYFNNGITVLSEKVEKTVKGGGDRSSGTFKCTGAQIVNGAQTVGSLKKIYEKDRERVEKGRVLVRLIEVGTENASLASEITRAANTQNKVEKKDFVTLDPKQEMLRREFYLENVQYIYKSGEQIEMPEYITLEEATSALACASGNLTYAILAKKEIGKLWENIDTTPYKDLFNQNLSSNKLYRYVMICRKIEEALSKHKGDGGDKRNLVVHANRIVQHMVFQLIDKGKIENPNENIDELLKEYTELVLTKMLAVRAEEFPSAMLGRLFYNQTKTGTFVKSVIQRVK